MSNESENKEWLFSSLYGRSASNGIISESNWPHIHIHGGVNDKKLLSIERELKDKGVYFDTANHVDRHSAIREWHLDWSLSGPMSALELSEYLDALGIEHNFWTVPKRTE